ncbi:23S rRNA (uracil(1939)-C(5))-methyltransferase RlmD [Sutcliffiella horikoshii]|uniref:23S rRNA (Uracil(1939)-C(5))-methyltransferase RlmD n=1 Tax=Sutcliffiella horikoshii TaxID=79883 RepID=A0A1Y0CJ90_9BACI|nr:23S rRNA (uracil(1939)-C(5))-methyltransferase RlmD [Sutcliffiella horikoshii]ART75341.1 23S rRNA (uracil(1939)-C(5))-methyltransferase RlmD [Sutcliffiella horikoshii]TYS58717.1 23S rRNA (uracil(1939)-C(5))-methyltransferase RlmD [Sutcliffiella horikoshii]
MKTKKPYNKQQQSNVDMKVGQTFPLTIKRLGINGEGVGYFKKQVVFVPGALPEEVVVAEVTDVKNKFAEAKIKKIRSKSPHRTTPPCPIYEQCGGCQLQHLKYDQQLTLKRDIVIQSLERHTKLNVSKLDIKPTIGMEDPWYYRNKSQFQVGKQKEKVIAGLYGANSHKLIDIDNCIVQHSATTEVTNTVKKILHDFNIPVHNEKKGQPSVRTIMTRVGFSTGEIQVVLITTDEKLPRKQLVVEEIQKRLPKVKSIMQNINGRKTSLIFGEETIHLSGEKVIQETLGDVSFELSARAFFQLNPVQTIKLYDLVKEAAQLTGKEKVVDAYCGVGTIGLWLAEGAGEVRGMDTIAESIDDAKENAKRHGYTNMKYVAGKAEKWLPRWVKEGWRPDTIVVDPPRTGLDETFMKTVLDVEPKNFVYVSCNPSTLAKDIQFLSKKYKVDWIQPVDMFPQTAHVESVVRFVLKKQ